MTTSDTGSFVVGLGLIGVLIILSILSLVSTTAATIGLIVVLPILVLYSMFYLSPKIQNLLEREKPVEPPFEFPNHSVTYNVSSSTTNEEDNKEYDDSKVSGGDEFNRASREMSGSRSPHDRSKQIQEAEHTLDIRHPYTEDELDTAYRKKVKIVHPDTNEGTQEEFKKIQDAYDLLLDEKTFTQSSSSDISENADE